MSIQSFHVKWLVLRRVMTDVTIRIGDGRLQDVEPGRASDAIELGSVALVDGLVNAHTHLEFSGMTSPIPAKSRFTDWIRAVVAYRREHPVDSTDAIRTGIRESVQSGTTMIGEIATTRWFLEADLDARFQGVIFQETLGLLPDRIAQQQEIARSHLDFDLGPISMGISPHAPYSTHLDLVHEAVKLACKSGCPLAMHLAETRAELELLQSGTGEFRELLQEFGIWREGLFPGGQRPMDYLQILAKAPRSLIIHGNYLDHDELSFIAKNPQMTLVYCPRTHAHFRHDEHPWLHARDLGAHVVLGTDSRASNPDLSLFAELQFLASENPDISHMDLLKLGSMEGRRALGFKQENQANFTLIRLNDGRDRVPERDLFAPANRVCGTMVGGKWAWLPAELTDQFDLSSKP